LVELCPFEVKLGLLAWLNCGTCNFTPGPFGGECSFFRAVPFLSEASALCLAEH